MCLRRHSGDEVLALKLKLHPKNNGSEKAKMNHENLIECEIVK